MENEIHVSQVAPGTVTIAWELSPQKKEFVSVYFQRPYESFVNAIRLYELPDFNKGENDASCQHEIHIPKEVKSWKLKGLNHKRQYCLEIGIKLSEDEFFPLVQSAPFQIHATKQAEYGAVESQTLVRPLSNNTAPPWEKKVSTYTYYDGKGNRGIYK